ncbi:max-binding protein MNT [Anguilla rostrata]|uniref:max-binding protein MNT n=1 Tax=Anguilla rostrata TaxID=7938 RepID=UPI0030D33FFC
MSASSYSPNSGIRFKRRKARFTFSEVHILLDEVRKNRHIIVGKFNRGVPTEVKKHTWAAITACINEIGECQREVIEVIKKWSDLKCDTKRKVAAIRAGAVPYRGMNSYLSRELSPIENIVHQILELDGKRGRLPTSDRNVYSGTGCREEEEGDEEEEEEAVTLGIPFSSVDNSNNGEINVPTIPLPPHPHGMPVPLSVPMSVPPSVSVPLSVPMSVPTSVSLPLPVPTSVSVPMSIPLSIPMPVSMSMPPVLLLHKEDHAVPSPVYCVRSRDTSHSPFEMQYEISYEDQELQLMDSDEEYQERALPPPNLPEDEHHPASLGHVTASATTSHPASSSSSSSGARKQSQPALSAQDKIAHCTALSIQEQHNTNVLLETVSRSLELLSESVQQLAETQQEFVHDSLQLQRETVHILRDFATGALALMHDKLNGRPAL